MTRRLQELSEAGVAIWADSIARDWLAAGELRRLRDRRGVVGVTSNPTIFAQALASGGAYDDSIRSLEAEGLGAPAVFEALALADIRAAARDLEPVYERTGGVDGRVSFELPPAIADDAAVSVTEAERVFRALGCPNVFIKIPATAAGVRAIRGAIAAGIPVNVTLIFSLVRYREVMEAYLAGLEDRVAAGAGVAEVASVASFFVSRLDSAVDERLASLVAAGGAPAGLARRRLGTAAIDNARLAYLAFEEVFSGGRWEALAAAGARVQRPLWASTSTKNPAYRDVLYVEELVAPQTVNTLPLVTLEAFHDHGRVRGATAREGLERARALWDELAELGIEEAEVVRDLERDGLRKFAASYDQAVATVGRRRAAVRVS